MTICVRSIGIYAAPRQFRSNPHFIRFLSTVNQPTSNNQSTDDTSEGLPDIGDKYVPLETSPFTPANLPVSPLMDPLFYAARAKHSQTKVAPQLSKQTDFQKQLAKNPYARALATPIRSCHLTRQRLPRFFLQDFTIVERPGTGEPVWVPKGLGREHDDLEVPEDELLDASVFESDNVTVEYTEASESSLDHDSEETSQAKECAEQQSASILQGVADTNPVGAALGGFAPDVGKHTQCDSNAPPLTFSYVLRRKEVIHAMTDVKSGYGRNPYSSMGGRTLLSSRPTKRLIEKSMWRPDMDEMILEVMRQRLCHHLRRILGAHKGYVVPAESWERARKSTQVGAFLWTGSARDESTDIPAPPEFGTVVCGSTPPKKVPAHNLEVLLGQRHMDELRSHSKGDSWSGKVLAVKRRNATIELLMKLWQLEGFVAKYRESDEIDPNINIE